MKNSGSSSQGDNCRRDRRSRHRALSSSLSGAECTQRRLISRHARTPPSPKRAHHSGRRRSRGSTLLESDRRRGERAGWRRWSSGRRVRRPANRTDRRRESHPVRHSPRPARPNWRPRGCWRAGTWSPAQEASLDTFEARRDVGRKIVDRDRLLRAGAARRRQPLSHHDRARRDIPWPDLRAGSGRRAAPNG